MTDNLTIVCWLWCGWRPLYDYRHVNALQRMLKANCSIPYRLVCVTDRPKGIECETVPLWDEPSVKVRDRYPNCYKRLKLFSPDARAIFGERVLSIDLDCIIFRDIAPLITAHEFRIVDGCQAPYNGSMWLHTTGTRTKVWDLFDPETSPAEAAAHRMPNGRRYLGSDQAWLAHIIPDEKLYTHEDGVYLFYGKIKTDTVPANARIMFFPGHRKPWDLHMQRYRTVYETYGKYL